MRAKVASIFIFALMLHVSLMCAQSESVLLSFKYPASGGYPISSLIYDSATLSYYGTTHIGGTGNSGTVFQLNSNASNWTETVLYNFQGLNDCSEPNYGVTPTYAKGVITALYGTCDFGGQYNYGAVFVLTPQTSGGWNEAIVYSFQGGSDGANPRGSVVIDPQGNLYGTTNVGGTNQGGTVYELIRNRTSWNKTVLYNFNSPANPEAHLIRDSKGALYGTTASDGALCYKGSVFQLVPPLQGQNWTYNVLHTFTCNSLDGNYPRGDLAMNGGALFGTTERGGAAGLGTVYEVLPPDLHHPNWREKVLYSFMSAATDGETPEAGVTLAKYNLLYGTTSAGGANSVGTAFKLQLVSGKWIKTTLWTFGGTGDGSDPWGHILLNGALLYGTTLYGGAYTYGTVYQLTP
jgi:uncharacterized repeat protein (TIGR03803 family)